MKYNCYPQRVYKNEDITLDIAIPVEGQVENLVLNVFTDGAVKKVYSASTTTIEDNTFSVTFNKGELAPIADGVLKFQLMYSVGEDDYTVNTNTNMILTTPAFYSAASIDDVYNEGYEAGYADGTEDCQTSGETWQSGYTSGYTDGYASGYTTGYTLGKGQGYISGYTKGESDGKEIGYNSGYTSGYNSGFTTGKNTGYTSGITYQKSLLTNTAFTVNGTFTRADGWSSVTVNVRSGEEVDNGYLYKYQTGTFGYHTPCDELGYPYYYVSESDEFVYSVPVNPFPIQSDKVIHMLYKAKTVSGTTRVHLTYNNGEHYVSPGKAILIPYGYQFSTIDPGCNTTVGDLAMGHMDMEINIIREADFNIYGMDRSVLNLGQTDYYGNILRPLIEDGIYGIYLFPYSGETGYYLPSQVFKKTEIVHITIPACITNIGNDAFNGSTLQTIQFESTTPPTIGYNAFANCNDLLIMYVPSGSKQAYTNALYQAGVNADKIREYTIFNDNTVYGN